eukprot:m.37064 g.37064  ORF g.37064 m.37064 type:complete len:643 (+) comp32318_c0_seq2:62-1990(+)
MTLINICRRKRRAACFRVSLLLTAAILLFYYIAPFARFSGESAEKSPKKEVEVTERPDNRPQPASRVNEKASPPRKPLCGLNAACGASEMAFHVVSGPDTDSAAICVDGEDIVTSTNSRRGMNVVVVQGLTRKVVAVKNFDTYSLGGEELAEFLNGINAGRLVIIASADDASYQLGEVGRSAVRSFGSSKIDSLNFRGSWLMIGQKGIKGTTIYEEVDPSELGLWSNGVEFSGCVPIQVDSLTHGVSAQQSFCNRYEGYGHFCSVSQASHPISQPPPTAFKHSIPVAVIASSSRGSYLVQCLQSLFSLPSLNSSLVSVFIDGFSPEIQFLSNLFQLKNIQFPKVKSTSNMEQIFKNADIVASHYFRSLKAVWELFPESDFVIIVEEDLIMSPDFLQYFHHLFPLLEEDKSVLTVSAWNDNGYLHSSVDNTKLYRSEFFPGLGWLLSKSLWNEISTKWPPCCFGWSWDLWLREPAQRKDRDSIYPDVSRVYHIGRNGLNVNGYYFDQYFKKRAFNKEVAPVLPETSKLFRDQYDSDLHQIISSGVFLDHGPNASPCDKEYIPDVSGGVFLIYYYQSNADDVKYLMKLCKCFKIWDLGVRGLYKGVLRFYLKGSHIVAVGSFSAFAFSPNFSNINIQPLGKGTL